MLTILSVAYPLATVSDGAAGGAEQILHMLDRAILAAGHRSLVLAREGSRVQGELIAVPQGGAALLDETAIAAAQNRHREALRETLQEHDVNLVHMHGFDFDAYLPPPGPPVLVTLHCPPEWHRAGALNPARPHTHFNAVSAHQQGKLGQNARLVPYIANGIDCDAYAGAFRRRRFALLLGRIAPEKGVHLALAAAHRAGRPLLVAGEVHPYPAHERYFAAEVAPLLDRERRWIGPVGPAAKRRLLGAASCLLVTSTVEETSSLTAREAAAAGTPVIAFRRGALVETVEHGRTGVLVDTLEEMAGAMARVSTIDSAECRRAALTHFDAREMTRRYLDLYGRLLRKAARAGAAA